jgi:sterol desaturase/sphingolipid hydroxylase (fatty acid hydroxylase superfamily)
MNSTELLIFQISTPVLLFLALIEWASSSQNYGWHDTVTNVWTAMLRFPLDLIARGSGLALFAWIYHFRFFHIKNPLLYWTLLLVLGDFMFWLMHWVSHQSRLFWATHAVHHSAHEMNLSVSLRADFWQSATKFFYYSPLMLFGFRGEDALVAYLITITYGNFLHTEAFPGNRLRWLEWVLVTPSMHRVHHASNVSYLDKNMGMVFSWWDRLFGTYVPENPQEKVVYGLVDQREYALPFEVVTHEFSAIARDLKRDGLTFRQKIKYLFAAPGWSHDGSRKTTREMQGAYKTLILLLALLPAAGFAQADHLLLVTSDGIRWQEVFEGADSSLLFNPKFVSDTVACRKKYWSADPEERRKKLMPFLWSTVAAQGQIHGNRKLGSQVDVANLIRISYPGYAEILTGRADPRIFDNHPWCDRNANILQDLSRHPGFSGKVGAFASWSNLYYVLNAPACDFPINAGSSRSAIKNWKKGPPPEDRKFWSPAILNTINRHDSITWRLAGEFLEQTKPAVLYISLMETDLIAHTGRYDETLDAIHRLDSLAGNLWANMQEDPEYRGRTAFFLTTDHGRGRGGFMGNWKLHNHLTAGSRQIWFAAMSPDLPARGEVTQTKGVIKAKQFARTITALVKVDFDKKWRGRAICLTALPAEKLAETGSGKDIGKENK